MVARRYARRVTPEALANLAHLPYAYLMTRRIERAKALLRRGDLSVTEVCMAVGCTSLGSFSARFTQLVGETPTAYRARDHGALASVPGCIAKDLTRPSRETKPEPQVEQDWRNAGGRGSLVLGA